MPTGYTAGILDGTTKDFKTYALHCARNFGATMHMRDKPFDAPYEAPKPSDYHPKRIAESNVVLRQLDTLTDQEIVDQERQSLINLKDQYEESKRKTEENAIKLKAFLQEAIEFKPPTKDHEGLHDFMCQQLHDTIKFDGDTRFYDDKLAEIELKLSALDAEEIRSERRIKAYADLSYSTENYQKELKRCDGSKKWMSQLLNSL